MIDKVHHQIDSIPGRIACIKRSVKLLNADQIHTNYRKIKMLYQATTTSTV